MEPSTEHTFMGDGMAPDAAVALPSVPAAPNTAPSARSIANALFLSKQRKSTPAKLARHRRKVAKLERRRDNALASGNLRRAKGLQRVLLNSYSAKYLAVVEADASMKPHRRVPLREIATVAATISPYQMPSESVRVLAQAKRSGGVRLVHDFDIQHKALQTLAARNLRPFAQLDHRQFLHHGGCNAAVAAIREHLEQAGHKWVIEADGKSFYANIDTDSLTERLSCPRRMTEVVIAPFYAVRVYRPSGVERRSSTEVMGVDARSGIPQGSRCSPLVGDIVVADIMAHMHPHAPVANYADNFFIFGKTKVEALQTYSALEEAFALTSNGCPPLVRKQLRRVDQGFDCLGYRIKATRHQISIEPKRENLQKFKLEVMKRVLNIVCSNETEADFRNYILAYLGAFQHWTARHIFTERLLAALRQTRHFADADIDATYAHLRAKAHESIFELVACAEGPCTGVPEPQVA